MTRAQYARYVLARALEALAILAGAAALTRLLQASGHLTAPRWEALRRLAAGSVRASAALASLSAWCWPALAGLLAHLALGPKQRRPVYLRIPGAMYAYAGVTVDRNAGCRGGCVTGSTGSGKTLACIVPRLHSLCVNECGAATPGRRVPPWGGFICGEKGNEWQMLEALLGHHGRRSDLCVLRTRPRGAPAGWAPAERFNLLSMDQVPADTYAKAIVDTGLAVEESGTRDEFFVPQARDKIAWGLRLARAAGAPSLRTLLDLLTVPESYRRFLAESMERSPGLAESQAFREARFQLENNYWNQPPDQLGGVRSTLHNFLAPFAEPEIAEVFCADSTLDLRDVERGRVVCLAIPQRLAVQRRYVATLMKTLVYQVILQRFDGGGGDCADRNVILVEQDEWQRHAVRADCEADVVREARGAVYAATQSQNAVWVKLGGREAAAPLLANLRNRWICQAATEECAEESSNLAGGRISREVSFSSGPGSRTTNVSFAERPLLPRRELRALAPFHVVFVPAEGPWLYRRCIAMPATADGRIPEWWFGDWNPLHAAARLLGLPERVAGLRLHPGAAYLPPWRASAPARAQARWLLGLDGTFIITGGMRSRDLGKIKR